MEKGYCTNVFGDALLEISVGSFFQYLVLGVQKRCNPRGAGVGRKFFEWSRFTVVEAAAGGIATARIIMPNAMVRLSAGRVTMSIEEQALCFLSGANSIFAGDELLTTPNPGVDQDKEMFQVLNLKPRASHKKEKNPLAALMSQ